MAKIGGRQVEIGIALETTPGTAVVPTTYPKWMSYSMNPEVEKFGLKSSRGVRGETSDSMIKKSYGNLQVVADPVISMYLWYFALGTKVTATHAGETTVFDHTLSVQNSNASMKTFTLTSSEGGVVVERYPNCMINSLNFECDNDFAKYTVDMIGQAPASTGAPTPAYVEETLLAYPGMTIKFGTSLSNAAAASATPLRDFKINVNNNLQVDEAFLSGANTMISGGLLPGPIKVTGSYSLHFSDTVELAKYKANTKNAAIVTLTGANVGVVPTPEVVKISLARLQLNKAPKVFNLDGLVILQQEFEVEYSGTEGKQIEVLVTNINAGTAL